MTMMNKAKTIARYMIDIAWPDPGTDELRVNPDAEENVMGADFVKPAFGRRKAMANQEVSAGLLLNP